MVQSVNDNQIIAWLRGLLTIAWADGVYTTEEQEVIAKITEELALSEAQIVEFKSITPTELANALGEDKKTKENFLRTAVLVALADGVYSIPEAKVLQEFSEALGLSVEALLSLDITIHDADTPQELPHPDLLKPVKHWLDGLEIEDPRLAKFLCKMIPPQCPFERDIVLFKRKIVHIPPLCKLNPLYEQLVGLRFRSLSYLADDCKEDISEYI
ncbi:MAG: nitrogenase [Gloeocapsa sp. DLM2.Bin57]|nr:MAG: nitrogenase [Gloeocapsa sp. DLM2.Bin57]